MIKFDEATHTYTLDGKRLISVTQLMQKHGLSPDYSSVPSEVLSAKAERGSLIHKEIEEFNRNGSIGFTNEMAKYKTYMETNGVECLLSETILYNDIIAGTADLVLYKDNDYIIADLKTTATLHKEAVSWQLSIYTYLFNKMHVGTTYHIKKGQAFHFDKLGNLNVVDIPLKPMDQVEALLECERNGTTFNPHELININIQALSKLQDLEQVIKDLEGQKKQADLQAQELRNILFEEMQARGLKTFETDGIRLTIKDAYKKTTIDSAKLKKEMPDIATQYSKTIETKATLLITLKETK